MKEKPQGKQRTRKAANKEKWQRRAKKSSKSQNFP
jgi:hypothetical protein